MIRHEYRKAHFRSADRVSSPSLRGTKLFNLGLLSLHELAQLTYRESLRDVEVRLLGVHLLMPMPIPVETGRFSPTTHEC
jgi:hypothetical protein